jgi:hypothetical protein
MCIYAATSLGSFYSFRNPKNFMSARYFFGLVIVYFAISQLCDRPGRELSVAEQS